jgi:peptidoglycan/xylan/chitin deacetylase (PgdA/CDA1 family)
MTSNPRIPFALSSARPRLEPPGGKPLIVQVVVNIENWRFDQPMPRKLITAPHGAETVPDVPNFSWAEYGMRCGMPRFFEALGSRGLKAGCTMNAAVIENYPEIAEAVLKAGWEFIGHGLHQKSVQAESSEEEVIAEALGLLSGFSGVPVQGWLGPGLKETDDTVDILKRQGLRYCSDWVLDDLPNWMTTRHGPMIAMPYSLEINDSVAHAVYQLPSDELYRRLVNTLEVFDVETKTNPRIVTIGLHPHLMGVPHRFGFLLKMLDLLMARDDTVFMTGSEIADWFEGVSPCL